MLSTGRTTPEDPAPTPVPAPASDAPEDGTPIPGSAPDLRGGGSPRRGDIARETQVPRATPVPLPAADDEPGRLRDLLLDSGVLSEPGDGSAVRVACARCGRPCRPSAAGAEPAWCDRCAAPGGGDEERENATTPWVPPPARGPTPVRGSEFGRYRILRELGRGGMGIVFQAEDPELRRLVAIKMLRQHDDPQMNERFLREARASATLDHPGIVPIHEVNVREGTPYYVMAFVEGRTLGEVIRRGEHPGTRERVRLVMEAAQAVAHAHARRVIHRDLKPSNILIDGAGRPHVVDFGLAKQLDEGTRLTSTGDLLGTPHYMPPEQLSGKVDQVGPPSDVYALGVVLYEAVTGRLPFEGGSAAEVIAATLEREPESPRARDPRVPLDVETICLTSLAKEPARRYPSAREFADDLGRFLRGEAIAARRESWGERARRWVRRRPATVAAAVACLSLAFAALAQREAARRQADQERVEGEFIAYLRQIASTNLDATLSLRRAGVGGDLADEFLARLEQAAREADRRAPDLAEPAYHLGRMYRALLRFDDALREQERALARAPDFAPGRYERAILDARRYRLRLARLRADWERNEGRRLAESGALARAGLGAQKLAEPPTAVALAERDPEAAELRRRILADLERLERILGEDRVTGGPPADAPGGSGSPGPVGNGLPPEGPRSHATVAGSKHVGDPVPPEGPRAQATVAVGDPVPQEGLPAIAATGGNGGVGTARLPPGASPGMLPCARGLFLLYGGRPEDRAEACRLLEAALARDPRLEEAYEGLAEACLEPLDFAAAEAVFARGLESDRGYLPFRLGRGEARWRAGDRANRMGGDPRAAFEGAVDDFTQALAQAPRSPEALLGRGRSLAKLADHLGDAGGDPEALFRRAIEDLGAALAIDPSQADAWRERGWAQAALGYQQSDRGGDPEELYRSASADLDEAILRDTESADAHRVRADLHRYWALFVKSRGADPTEHYRAALSDYGRSLELDPYDRMGWRRRAGIRFYLANWLKSRGGEVGSLFEEAEADLEKARELAPDDPGTWADLGQLRLYRGGQRVEDGVDPTEDYRAAILCYDRSLQGSPGHPAAWSARGAANLWWAEHRLEQGEDPGPNLALAEADFRRALERVPGSYDVLSSLAQLMRVRARAGLRAGKNPSTWLDQAITESAKAAESNPKAAEAWMGAGSARAERAAWRAERAAGSAEWAGAEAEFAAARAELDRALAVTEGWDHVWLARAGVFRRWAAARAAHGGEADSLFGAAESDATQALGINPRLAQSWVDRAETRRLRAAATGARGGDAGPLRAAAIADFTRAIELAPAWAEPRAARARVRLDAGDVAGASADAAAAVERAPARTDYAELLAKVRGSGAGD